MIEVEWAKFDEETGYHQVEDRCGVLMTVDEFYDAVKAGCYTNDDGFGEMINDGMFLGLAVIPSEIDDMFLETTHVLWYNK